MGPALAAGHWPRGVMGCRAMGVGRQQSRCFLLSHLHQNQGLAAQCHVCLPFQRPTSPPCLSSPSTPNINPPVSPPPNPLQAHGLNSLTHVELHCLVWHPETGSTASWHSSGDSAALPSAASNPLGAEPQGGAGAGVGGEAGGWASEGDDDSGSELEWAAGGAAAGAGGGAAWGLAAGGSDAESEGSMGSNSDLAEEEWEQEEEEEGGAADFDEEDNEEAEEAVGDDGSDGGDSLSGSEGSEESGGSEPEEEAAGDAAAGQAGGEHGQQEEGEDEEGGGGGESAAYGLAPASQRTQQDDDEAYAKAAALLEARCAALFVASCMHACVQSKLLRCMGTKQAAALHGCKASCCHAWVQSKLGTGITPFNGHSSEFQLHPYHHASTPPAPPPPPPALVQVHYQPGAPHPHPHHRCALGLHGPSAGPPGPGPALCFRRPGPGCRGRPAAHSRCQPGRCSGSGGGGRCGRQLRRRGSSSGRQRPAGARHALRHWRQSVGAQRVRDAGAWRDQPVRPHIHPAGVSCNRVDLNLHPGVPGASIHAAPLTETPRSWPQHACSGQQPRRVALVHPVLGARRSPCLVLQCVVNL